LAGDQGSEIMKIAVFLPDLCPGGAERMHLHMAEHWLRSNIQTEFVLSQQQGELLNLVPRDATVVNLGATRVRSAIRPLARYLRDSRPQALLAAMWPLTAVSPLAARIAGFRGRVVISEHAPQSMSYAERGKFQNILMCASMGALYPCADARVAVSEGVANDMARLSGMDCGEITVIHNPAAVGRVVGRSDCKLPSICGAGPLVLSVGTLKPVKRHDLLIRAFARMEVPSARLCILGEGQERERLEALVRELGMCERVLLRGFEAVTAPWYAHADLFVLSSDHEGFGNVIVEALEQGTPVVSTDCPFGPREILENGKFGTLVPVGDVDALAKAMEDALSRTHDREGLKRRAQDFSVDKAADSYLDLLLPGWRESVR
jgi:glycosyltransferase involved in cell wall biosynthesis